MGLIGKIDRGVGGVIGQIGVAGHGQAGEVGHGAAADKQAASSCWKFKQLAQPFNRHHFDLCGTRWADPCATENVER